MQNPTPDELRIAADFLDDAGFSDVAEFLRRTRPNDKREGIPCILGPADGKRIESRRDRIEVPVANYVAPYLTGHAIADIEIATVTYQVERFRYGENETAVFVPLDVDNNLALIHALDNYQGTLPST